MLWWRTLEQNAKGCHYKTTFMMTKEQWQRSIEEKNTENPWEERGSKSNVP